MSDELICTWLRLPANSWPPDHYALLGIVPDEANPAVIEASVHERMEWLRCYQLTHPEQVTAAMNRLAQAFTCVTDPQARKAYDATLWPEKTAARVEPPVVATTTPPAPAASGPEDPLAWLYGPWNQSSSAAAPAPMAAEADKVARAEAPRAEPAAVNGPPQAQATELDTEPPIALPVGKSRDRNPLADVVDPVVAAARSPAARRGLGTRRGLYRRIVLTRQLLVAWEHVGRYVGDAERRLTRRSEVLDLVQQLSTIRRLLHGFPPLVGQAGQPGYSVVTLARQQQIVQTYQTLLPRQREVLAQHWKAGWTLLDAHRRFLREEVHQLRAKGPLARAFCAVQSAIVNYPGPWLIILGLVALNLAYPPLRSVPVLSLGIFLALLVLDAFLRGLLPGNSWLDRSGPTD
jgi:hypothetical protein